MGLPSSDAIGLAIIRIWLDRDSPVPLRTRLTTTEDITAEEAKSTEWTGTDHEEVIARVTSWLDRWVDARTHEHRP